MLPYNLNFTPFDQLQAEELNMMVANDEALSNGSGQQPSSIPASAINFSTFYNSGQLIVKTRTVNYNSTLPAAGNVFSNDVSMGTWPAGGFNSLIGVWVQVSNRQYWFSVNDTSNTSAGNVRLFKHTAVAVNTSVTVIGIGI